jgi:phosphate uptake regulator
MTAIRDKHLKLDQVKLNRARQFLGTKTERETIESALDLLLAENDLERLLEQLGNKGTVKKVFR